LNIHQVTDIDVTVWDSTVRAWLAPKEINQWISQYLGVEARLVRIRRNSKVDKHSRSLPPKFDSYQRDNDVQVAFSDGFPFLLTSESSLSDLNSRLLANTTKKYSNSLIKQSKSRVKIDMRSFRPNIVIQGSKPFDEDYWKKISIQNHNSHNNTDQDHKDHADNDVELHLVKPCSRCQVPNIDQVTGARNPFNEPSQSLHQHRKWNDEVYFGQNLLHVTSGGRVAVGDRLQVIERQGDHQLLLHPAKRVKTNL